MSGAGDSPLPERDPLADLVSRSVGARVESVAAEALESTDDLERKRLRFDTTSGPASAIFIRSPRGRTLEAQLLPFLARKTDRVPTVHSRGLPPPHASLGPWLLIEDVLAGASGCDGDVREIVRAKLAIERAVAKDAPALRALGLTDGPAEPPRGLATAPIGLVHGGLDCASARRVARGVVLIDWSRAFLGPTVLDAVSLAADLESRGDATGADRVRETYFRESGDASPQPHWDAAYLNIA
jgi:hypothetical protein